MIPAADRASGVSAQLPGTGRFPAWRSIATAALLAAGATAWTAEPLDTGRPGTKIALIAAIATAILSIAQLVVITAPRLQAPDFATLPERAANRLLGAIRAAPWAEMLLLALLALEALHPARPWHTGLLGVALLAYLFATHLVETRARPGVLRAQLPVVAAGVGLLALAVGAAALPALSAGPESTTIRVVAIVSAVIAAGLAVPVGGSRS